MRSAVRVFAAPVAALILLPAGAQQRPAFVAADVHRSPADATASGGALPDGIEFRGATLLRLITYAYGVPEERVSGGPSWLDTDRFDVRAKAPGPMREAAVRLMLRPLLEERFGLDIVRRERPAPALVLSVGRASVLRESAGGGAPGCELEREDNVRILACRNTTLGELAEQLPAWAPEGFKLPVVDRTGLAGAYDFTLRYATNQTPGTGGGAALFHSIERQTGIRVTEQTAPVAVWSVERVNREPAPNPPGTAEMLGPAPAAFEVADIRPSPPGTREDLQIQNGRIEGRAVNLREMIAFAYNVEEEWVRGEKWIESARFDVRAKSAPTASDDTLRAMARSLLEERFHFRAHKEQQPVEVYALVKGRPKLKAPDAAARATCKAERTGTTRAYVCRNATLDRLVERLNEDSGGYLQRKVVDMTSLAGAYDFTLTWTLPFSLAGADGAPAGLTLFEAVERQLGLKLVMRKHPMPVLVIDHVDRQPTEN